MSKTVVAKRYAVALFNLAKEHGQVEAVQSDLNEVKTLFSNNTELISLLTNPKLSTKKKKELLTTIFGDANQFIQNTLAVLVDKNRIGETVNLADAYTDFANEMSGIAQAKVFSTRPLSDEEQARLSAAFATKIGKESLKIENVIDPDLLGGVRLQIGNRIYDGSLKGKLTRLERELIGS